MYTEKFTKRPEREINTMITYRGERIHQISTPCEIYIVSTAVNVNFPLCVINTHAHSARSTFTSCISSIYVCAVTGVNLRGVTRSIFRPVVKGLVAAPEGAQRSNVGNGRYIYL